MTKTLRRLILCLALVSMPSVGSAFGDQIGGPGLVPPGTSYDGFYVGTYLGVNPAVPNGVDVAAAAQLIPSDFDYSDLSLTVQLYGSQGNTVDFALAPNDSGVPGTPIGTASVTLNGVEQPNGMVGDVLAEYTVQFPDASLDAGTWYWLVATSPDVGNFFEGPFLPVWALSPGYDFPLVWSDNGGPWMISNTGPESFAYELDGVQESDTFVSAGAPPVVPTPEPSSLLLLLCGFGMLALLGRLLRTRASQNQGPLRARLRSAT